MSYTKQNFKDGSVLTADQMKKIEVGILEAEYCDQENIIKILTIPTGELEGSVSYDLSKGAGPYAAIIANSDLAQEAFDFGRVTSHIGSHNYSEGLGTTVKGTFETVESLPWQQNLKADSFEYAEGNITVSLREAQVEDVSYICILAKDGSAEACLGDMIINTLNPLIDKVNDLENRLAQIEATL